MLFIKYKILSLFKKILRFVANYEYFSFKIRELNGPVDLLKNESAQESLNFLKSIDNKYFICQNAFEIRKLVIDQINDEGYIIEFGVHKGK